MLNRANEIWGNVSLQISKETEANTYDTALKEVVEKYSLHELLLMKAELLLVDLNGNEHRVNVHHCEIDWDMFTRKGELD